MVYKVAPLSAGFMLTSIVGIIISAFYVYPSETTFAKEFGFTFIVFFMLMLVASLISMTYAPIEAEFDVKREKTLRKKGSKKK